MKDWSGVYCILLSRSVWPNVPERFVLGLCTNIPSSRGEFDDEEASDAVAREADEKVGRKRASVLLRVAAPLSGQRHPTASPRRHGQAMRHRLRDEGFCRGHVRRQAS